MEIVGQRLKALRESMGISQAKIALLLDSKQPNINRFEHNQSEPPLALLCRYADFFDVSLDYILGRTDQPQGKLYEYKPTYDLTQVAPPNPRNPNIIPIGDGFGFLLFISSIVV